MRRILILAAFAVAYIAACGGGPPCDQGTQVLLAGSCEKWCDPGNHSAGVKIDGKCINATAVDPNYHEGTPGTAVVNNTTTNNTTTNNTTNNTTTTAGTTTTTTTTNTGGAGGSSTGTNVCTITINGGYVTMTSGDQFTDLGATPDYSFTFSGKITFALTSGDWVKVDVSPGAFSAFTYTGLDKTNADWETKLQKKAMATSGLGFVSYNPLDVSFQGDHSLYVIQASCP